MRSCVRLLLHWLPVWLLCCAVVLPAGAQNSKAVRAMKAQRAEIQKQIEASEKLLRTTKRMWLHS